MSYAEGESRAERMKRRLNNRSKGLLESSTTITYRKTNGSLANATVQYLHRTVRDYMANERNFAKAVSYSEDCYDPNLFLSLSYLLDMKTADRTSMLDFWKCATWCMEYAALSAASLVKNTTSTAVRILDSLDNAADTLSRRSPTGSGSSLLHGSCKPSLSGLTSYWTGMDFEDRRGLEMSDFLSLAVVC